MRGRPAHDRYPDLIWFHSHAAGPDGLVRDGAWPESVLLTRTVGRLPRKIAEYVLAWVLTDAQRTDTYTDQSRRKQWQRQTMQLVEGETAVVFGVGRAGSAVAQLLSACGVHVVGVATKPRSVAGFAEVVDTEQAPTMVGDARWIVSTFPLTNATAGYFDSAIFGEARGASYINVGRGATID